jgi:hypothetical protein
MKTLRPCWAEAFENIALSPLRKSLLSACLRCKRSLHAKFQASRLYGLGFGMVSTFTSYIEIKLKKAQIHYLLLYTLT